MLRSIIVLGLSAICVFAATLSYAVEETDILVYYSFDRLNGKKVLDDSGNGNEAELVGKGSLVDGAFKKAIRLNGGIVQMAANDFIVPVGQVGEITMEAWFYLNEHAAYDGIISIEAAAAGCCEYRTMVNPTFNPFWDAGHHADKSLGNFKFELDEWYHYVMVADGKDGKIYINGEFIGAQPENFDLPEHKEAAIYIGAGENPNVHRVEDAIIDEVVIYAKALTEEEIQASMEMSVPGVLAVEARGKLTTTWGELKTDF
ncbi:LamG domain-containing protein [Candidatus Poribacteria bacterium]|nr:LamG domain-containing protein [Candidatus Poribacteria bacterium]MYH80946.1 LamG domain-containing protein [Candidatus Poribacteria bacterium]MYK92706.1 LamG domain-containing protein [Candidatus Poribacteria bacterium]